MAVTPLFGVPMDGGAQSFDGVSQSDPQSPTMTPAGPKHHSGFQNVLGFLGDFLMSRLHMGTPYHDARESEKLNEARLLDEQDPAGNYARVGAINPAFAHQLQATATDDKRLAASAAMTTEMRQARIAAQKEALRKDVTTRAAGYFNGLDPKSPTFKKDYANGRQLWNSSSAVRSDPDLAKTLNDMFPEKFDANMVHSSIASTVAPAKQWDQAITKDRNSDIADHNAATEELGTAKLDATTRHQKVMEGQGAARVAIADRRATTAANRPVKQPAIKAAKPTGEMISYLRAHPEKRDSFDGKFGVGMAKKILGN